MDPNYRAQVVERYTEIKEVIDSLSVEAATQAGAAGEWSACNVLAHLIGWQEEAHGHLEALRDGTYERRQYDFDTFNAAAVEKRRDHDWPTLVRELDEWHHKMLDLADALPDELWQDKRVHGWMHAVTDHHYEEHLPHLRAAAQL
jgi:hypothetical protein